MATVFFLLLITINQLKSSLIKNLNYFLDLSVVDSSDPQLSTIEGEDLTVSITVEEGVFDVTWTVCCRGLQIINSTKFLLLENLPLISLTIADVNEEDSGTYTVTVSNGTDQVERSFTVQVQGLCQIIAIHNIPCSRVFIYKVLSYSFSIFDFYSVSLIN